MLLTVLGVTPASMIPNANIQDPYLRDHLWQPSTDPHHVLRTEAGGVFIIVLDEGEEEGNEPPVVRFSMWYNKESKKAGNKVQLAILL